VLSLSTTECFCKIINGVYVTCNACSTIPLVQVQSEHNLYLRQTILVVVLGDNKQIDGMFSYQGFVACGVTLKI